MTWKLRLVEFTDIETLEIGDCFYTDIEKYKKIGPPGYIPFPINFGRLDRMSPHYFNNNSHRLPIVVFMPSQTFFCLDALEFSKKAFHGSGWAVTGNIENLSVFPSININGCYHGFIQNGIITEDCEGRVYNEQGALKRKK